MVDDIMTKPSWQKLAAGGIGPESGIGTMNSFIPGQVQQNRQPNQQGSWLSSLFGGTSGQNQQFSTLSPQQQQMQQMLMQLLGPQLQQQFGQQNGAGFSGIENQARQGFAQNTIPTIMERFGASNSSEASSALPQMLGSAGAEFETGLDALRSQHNMQQNQQLLQLLSSLMQPHQENVYNQRQPGLLESVSPGVLSGLMKLLPLMI